MKTPDETIAYIARQLGYVYLHRPIMYGGSPEGVDVLLRTYHELWAEIVDRQDDYQDTFRAVLDEEDCGAAIFSTRYQLDHPNATDVEAADYSAVQWRKISERLGIPVPYDELAEEFKDFPEDSPPANNG